MQVDLERFFAVAAVSYLDREAINAILELVSLKYRDRRSLLTQPDTLVTEGVF
jgi:hypothetical protein